MEQSFFNMEFKFHIAGSSRPSLRNRPFEGVRIITIWSNARDERGAAIVVALKDDVHGIYYYQWFEAYLPLAGGLTVAPTDSEGWAGEGRRVV